MMKMGTQSILKAGDHTLLTVHDKSDHIKEETVEETQCFQYRTLNPMRRHFLVLFDFELVKVREFSPIVHPEGTAYLSCDNQPVSRDASESRSRLSESESRAPSPLTHRLAETSQNTLMTCLTFDSLMKSRILVDVQRVTIG